MAISRAVIERLLVRYAPVVAGAGIYAGVTASVTAGLAFGAAFAGFRWLLTGIHETAHLVAAWGCDFEPTAFRIGLVSYDFRARKVTLVLPDNLAGSVRVLPRSFKQLQPRIRVFAGAGVLATVTSLALASAVAWNAPGLVTFALLTAAVLAFPGAFFLSGDGALKWADFTQARCPRIVLAEWATLVFTHLALVGAVVEEQAPVAWLESLLPDENPYEPAEGLELLFVTAALHQGAIAAGRRRLEILVRRHWPREEWKNDVALQHTALVALVDGDAARARQLATRIDPKQADYAALASACVLAAEGELAASEAAVAAFAAGLRASKHPNFLLSGNRWILKRLGAGGSAAAAKCLEPIASEVAAPGQPRG